MRRAFLLLPPLLLVVAAASCAPSDEDTDLEDDGVGTSADAIVDGKRVVDGDIVVEPEDEAPATGAPMLVPQGYARQAKSLYWPNGIVPYTIASSVSATHRSRIVASIKEWQTKTAIRWVPRKAEAAYVTFTEPANNNICSADLGHIAGTHRFVYLRDSDTKGTCNLGVMTHEMGHTIGLVHEHQRTDRDQYVKIDASCIPTGLSGAFAFTTTPSNKVGAYDIVSTMHYRSTTLTKPGCGGYSITAKNGKALLHDWSTLSAGDVATVAELYGPVKPPPAPDAGAPDAAPDAEPATPPSPPDVEPPHEEEDEPLAASAGPKSRIDTDTDGCTVSTTGRSQTGDYVGLAFIAAAITAAARARSSRRSSCTRRSADRT